MDTLTLSQTLQNSGLEQKPAETIAKSIVETVNENHKKLTSKRDLYFFGAVMITGFGYIYSTQNTIINAILTITK